MSTSPGDFAALHAVLSFPIMAFIPFLLLKYHNANASPFDDNSRMILAFFISTLTYVAAMLTEFKLLTRDLKCPNFITNISHLSAPLATIALVTIPFPYLGWFLSVIWFGFFVKLALDSYQEFFMLVADAVRCVYQLIRNKNEDQTKNQSSATSDAIASDSIV